MNTPLKGITVIELARVLAGPWIGQTLADLGATVIKIESPEGDETRQWGPPYIERLGQKNAAYFHCCNRGKQSFVADLKIDTDLQQVKQLISHADIFIENFRVGGLKKFNLDYQSLSKKHPLLVYCSVSGFGQDGPYAAFPGYDFLAQATSGIMSVTGEAERDGQKIGVAFADIFTALYGIIGIQSALLQRQQSGKGQHIDVALLDSMVGVMANQAMNFLATGHTPQRMGNRHPNIAPYQSLPTADGDVIVAVGNNRQFAALCDLLALPHLLDDARFIDNAARVKNQTALTAQLSCALQHWQRNDFISQAQCAGIPVAGVNTIAEAFAHPQVIHRGLQQKIDNVPTIRPPLRFSDTELIMDRPSPNLGEHTNIIKKNYHLL